MAQPVVLWSQNKESVFVTFEIRDVSDLKVDLKPTSLEITCKGNMGTEYHSVLTFFEEINVDDSQYATNRSLVFNIVKKVASEQGENWPRLLSEKKKWQWLKVDWSKFEDSDAEEAAAPEGMDWTGGMGGGMPGMGGMGGMPGMEGLGGMMGGMGGMPGMEGLGGMGGMPGMEGLGGDGGFDMAKMQEMMEKMGLNKEGDGIPDLETDKQADLDEVDNGSSPDKKDALDEVENGSSVIA